MCLLFITVHHPASRARQNIVAEQRRVRGVQARVFLFGRERGFEAGRGRAGVLCVFREVPALGTFAKQNLELRVLQLRVAEFGARRRAPPALVAVALVVAHLAGVHAREEVV